MTRLRQSILVLVCLTLLVGCGFKLRGAYQLPSAMQQTYISDKQRSTDLGRALVRSLKASNIQLVDELSDTVAVFDLIKESKGKRIVSVDSKGRAREYTLSLSLLFSVTARHKNFEISEQEIRIDRDFVFDTQDVLGNSREQAQLYAEMQQDLIRLILLRLQSHSSL